MTIARPTQAGVTLVEVLVVLVLIRVMAAVVGLSLGPANRGSAAGREAQLLVTRLNRAADEAVLTGAPMALVWTDVAYKFLILQADRWIAHPVPILGTPHVLDQDLRFGGEQAGQFVVMASLRPASGAALDLTLGDGAQLQTVVFDGATAHVSAQAGP